MHPGICNVSAALPVAYTFLNLIERLIKLFQICLSISSYYFLSGYKIFSGLSKVFTFILLPA